jgi:hypothetical protein
VREVGFEPTNPYGTGASGLRVQDPFFYTGLFDLAWQNGPPLSADSRNTRPAPAENTGKDKALIGFPYPSDHEFRKMFISTRTLVRLEIILVHPVWRKKTQTWPPGVERHEGCALAGAMAGDGPANTVTAECKVDMETRDGNATGGAALSATAGRSEKPDSHQSTRNHTKLSMSEISTLE